jgi:hypothetical protein
MNAVDRYLIFGQRRVEGWLEPYSADFIRMLSESQRDAGFRGAVGEIGVHHGKLLILLACTAAADERVFAIDVFENQSLNTDRSGRGDRLQFMRNLHRWYEKPGDVEVISISSLEIKPSDIIAACGQVRLASIDGGHTEECTLNDLRLVEGILTPEGVAIVDDYFNQNWPDVSTGVAKYLLESNSKLRPFVITPNKLYLTASANIEAYRLLIEAHQEFSMSKRSQMFGWDVDIYGTGLPARGLYARTSTFLKDSPIGPYLQWAKNSFA